VKGEIARGLRHHFHRGRRRSGRRGPPPPWPGPRCPRWSWPGRARAGSAPVGVGELPMAEDRLQERRGLAALVRGLGRAAQGEAGDVVAAALVSEQRSPAADARGFPSPCDRGTPIPCR
jgi:hypothetical protein